MPTQSTFSHSDISPSIVINTLPNSQTQVINSFPPNRSSQTTASMDERERILINCANAYYRSIYFSSKLEGVCELSDTPYPSKEDDENNGVFCKQLTGISYISSHHCYGVVQYHISNIDLFPIVEAYKDFDHTMVTRHNLQGKSLQIKRSNGNIEIVTINSDAPLTCYKFNGVDKFIIIKTTLGENSEYVKKIPLHTYTNETDNAVHTGFIEMNPTVFTDDFVLRLGYQDHPYMETERTQWKTDISNLLGNIKHEFYTYE